MIKSILAAIAAVLLSLAPNLAVAQSAGTVQGVSGTWWNATRNGEGIVLEELASGQLVAYWYTYDDVAKPLWLIGVGELRNNAAELTMTRAEGARFGSAFNAADVQRSTWGTMTFQINTCDSVRASYRRADGMTGAIDLVRLSGALRNSTCTVVPAPQLSIKLERCDSFFGGCSTRSLPYVGTSTQQSTVIGGGSRLTIDRFRLTVTGGEITLRNVATSDSRNLVSPAFTGISDGMVVREGSPVTFDLTSGFTRGQTTTLRFQFDIDGRGRQFDQTINLTTN